MEPPTDRRMPSWTPKVSVVAKATTQRAASARETRAIWRTCPGSKSEATAQKMMAERAAYGSHSNAGVRSVTTSRMTAACQSPCAGVHTSPARLATSAERDSDAEAGYAEKKEPTTLHMPRETSSCAAGTRRWGW
eukprot:scaffold222665_cov28-Tisochrysis_lutea.AAC.3